MPTLKDLRKDLTSLRNNMRATKAGLNAWKTGRVDPEVVAAWRQFSSDVMDRLREDTNAIIAKLDDITGKNQ